MTYNALSFIKQANIANCHYEISGRCEITLFRWRWSDSVRRIVEMELEVLNEK